MATPVNLHTSSGVSVLYEEPGTGILLAAGRTPPAAGSVGYAKWCLFIHTDASAVAGGTYINTGTKDSCEFVTTLDNVVSLNDSGVLSVTADEVTSAATAVTVGGVLLSGGSVVTSSAGLLQLGNVGTKVAAGTDQAGATLLTNQITFVTGTGVGAEGVRLPAATAGLIMLVYDTVAATGLKVYPATGDDIEDGTTNAAITIEGQKLAMFIGLDTTTWAAIYTAN